MAAAQTSTALLQVPRYLKCLDHTGC